MPPCLAHVWAWWHDLAQTRRSNGFGIEPIGYADILAWAVLTRSAPRPVEVGAIVALDRAYLDHIAQREKPK